MTTHHIQGGYSVCGGRCRDGWYAGVLLLDDTDLRTYESETPDSFEQQVERCRPWQARVVNRPRCVALVRPAAAGLARTDLAAAERIDGPVCPREDTVTPVLAWTERCDDQWALKLYHEGAIHTVFRQAGMLIHPQVALTSEGMLLACEVNSAAGAPEVILIKPDGREVARMPGRTPRLAATGPGMAILTEQCSRNGISLKLMQWEDGAVRSGQEIHQGDYTFNADLAWTGRGRDVFVAAESCPAFGEDSQRGKHRDILIWRCHDQGIEPVAGESGPALPVEPRAFQSLGPENLPPIRPQIFVDAGQPVVVFRQFRYRGMKTFGWDVFWCRHAGSGWSHPVRLSPCQCLPDTGVCIMPAGNRYVGMFPALENDGKTTRSYGHRVEFLEFEGSHGLERFDVPADKRHAYSIPTGYKAIAPEPAALPNPYPGRTLVWGDLHVHSTYSKCVAAADGSPAENLRFARHSLGCRVFTLTEHTNALSNAEVTWCLDQLEQAAGDDGVVLYGTEPGHTTAHHTNWYAHDREVFERLLVALSSHKKDRLLDYRHAREGLPPGSVIALRHFHGRPSSPDEMLQSFEPLLEVAMEAMQGRCNALLDPAEKTPKFPSSFLNMGCKLGIVGGTDHFRGGPNHLCLTGFWVTEISARGVWEAIRNRYTFGMSNAKIAMAAHLADQPMGGAVSLPPAVPVRIRLGVSCGYKVRRAALLRDGELLPWVPVEATSATLDLVDAAPPPGRHWYIPTVEVDTAFGPGRPGYGHTSPFFVLIRPQ